MKRKLFLAIFATAMVMTACGEKATGEVKEEANKKAPYIHQEESRSQQELADQLTQIAVAVENEAYASEEAKEECVIHPSIKKAMDETMYMFDSSIFNMSEEEIAKKYSSPTYKDEEHNKLIWESDDFGGTCVSFKLGNPNQMQYMTRVVRYDENVEEKRSIELGQLEDFLNLRPGHEVSSDLISDWISKGFPVNPSEFYSMTYDEFVEKIGTGGIVTRVDGKNVGIMWPVQGRDFCLSVAFYVPTGEAIDLANSPTFDIYVLDEEGNPIYKHAQK